MLTDITRISALEDFRMEVAEMDRTQLMCKLEQFDDLMNPESPDEIDGVPVEQAVAILEEALRQQ